MHLRLTVIKSRALNQAGDLNLKDLRAKSSSCKELSQRVISQALLIYQKLLRVSQYNKLHLTEKETEI